MVVNSCVPCVLPGPSPRQVQGEAAGGAGDPGGDMDQVGAQGGGGGLGMEDRGQGARGPQQVVGHGPQDQPRGVRVELPRGQVGQGAGLAVGNDLLDDCVVAVLPLGLEGLERAVGEERVVAPDRKQLALFADGGRSGQVTDPAHDEPGGDVLGLLPAGKGSVVRYLGDLGVRDQLASVGIDDRSGIADRRPRALGYGGDCALDRGVHPCRDREVGTGPPAGCHHVGVVELGVRAQDADPGAAGLRRGGQGFGDESLGAAGVGGLALPQPDGRDDLTGGRGTDRGEQRVQGAHSLEPADLSALLGGPEHPLVGGVDVDEGDLPCVG